MILKFEFVTRGRFSVEIEAETEAECFDKANQYIGASCFGDHTVFAIDSAEPSSSPESPSTPSKEVSPS